jgi:predicted DNA-binding transcriptional regulator AlpA
VAEVTAAEADELLTLSELAELAGVKTATAKQWGKRGQLPAPWAWTPAGRLWRREDVEEWLAARAALSGP